MIAVKWHRLESSMESRNFRITRPVMDIKETTHEVVENCRQTTRLLVVVYNELWRTRVFTVAAALAFYFLLSLVPLIVIFSSLLQFLPIPDVFQKLLDLMAQIVPAD